MHNDAIETDAKSSHKRSMMGTEILNPRFGISRAMNVRMKLFSS